MKEQGKTPNERDSKKAGDVMKRAIDRTVEAEKNRDNFGNEQGKHDAADELKGAAEKDTGKKASHWRGDHSPLRRSGEMLEQC